MGFFSRNKDKPAPQPAPKVDPAREEEDAILGDMEVYFIQAGFDRNSARNNAAKTLEVCKKQCEEDGQAAYSKIGEKVYEMANTDEFLAQCIKAAEGDRATRAEIIDWWSASDLQRKVVMALDEQEKLAHFIDAINRGMTQENAAAFVKKKLPTYGYSMEFKDKNRPICPERKARVVDYLSTMNSSDMMRESLARNMEKHESFNALFRSTSMY